MRHVEGGQCVCNVEGGDTDPKAYHCDNVINSCGDYSFNAQSMVISSAGILSSSLAILRL